MKQIIYLLAAVISIGVLIANYQGDLPSKNVKIQYIEFLHRFGKDIPSGSELQYRVKIFQSNLALIGAHNANPTYTWKMGINQFTDLTQEQFINTYLGETTPHREVIINEEVNQGFSGEKDWRKEGIVTAVKNQGKCGSCWAFGATAAHQSYQVQKKQQDISISLSEQQLVDCAKDDPYLNNGCGGGLAARALQYIKDFGQTTTEEYPYMAVNQECKNPEGKYHIYGVAQITGCSQIETVIQTRPMAVRVDATNWHLYASGIFDNCNTRLNHAVFLVGTSQEAWTIKNSWDVTWGQKGFIRLKKGNTCGVCIGPSYPF